MTTLFAKQVLSGEKFLLKQSEVKRVSNAPQFKEFKTSIIWSSLKQQANSGDCLKYFPDYGPKVLPSKAYLMNVLNTLDPGLIIKTIQQLQKEKRKKKLQEAPIQIRQDWLNKLNSFQTIHQDTVTSAFRIVQKSYPECIICRADMKSGCKKFKCQSHYAHKECVVKFYASQIAQQGQFKCPFKCH